MQQPITFPRERLNKCLPELVCNLATISSHVQVPFEMSFLNFLNHANHPAQIAFRVKSQTAGKSKSISLFSFLIAETGERKSTLDAIFNTPRKAFEGELSAIYRKECIDLKIQKEYAKRDGQVLAPKNIKHPLIVSSCPTVEGVKRALLTGQRFHSIFSSEGAAFLNSYSFSKDNYLKTLGELSDLKDGISASDAKAGELTHEKIQNNEVGITRFAVSFSMFLSMQPVIFRDFLTKKFIVDQGFLGRYLILAPESMKGERGRDPSVPFEQYLESCRRISDCLSVMYHNYIDMTCEDYNTLCIKESDYKLHKKISHFYEQFTTLDNPFAIASSFCGRREEHTLSIAATLQSYRNASSSGLKKGEVQDSFIDSDILELSWDLFRYFYGQFFINLKDNISVFANAVLPAKKQLFDETAKFLSYLKKSVKKKMELSRDEQLKDLTFPINTRLFRGISRVYEKKDNISTQVRILVDEGFLISLEDKKFKFVDFTHNEDLNKFPDHSAVAEPEEVLIKIDTELEDIEYNPGESAVQVAAEELLEYLIDIESDFYREYTCKGWTIKQLKSSNSIALPRVRDNSVIDGRRLEEIVEYLTFKKFLFSFEVQNPITFKATTHYALIPDLVDEASYKSEVKTLYHEHVEKPILLKNHAAIAKMEEQREKQEKKSEILDIADFRKKFGF